MLAKCVLVLVVFIIIVFLVYKPNGFMNKQIVARPSNVHGMGLYAKEDIYPEERIFDGINYHFITKQGSLINHSWNSNATPHKEGFGKYGIYANKTIKPNEELTINYNDKNLPFYILPAKSYWK